MLNSYFNIKMILHFGNQKFKLMMNCKVNKIKKNQQLKAKLVILINKKDYINHV